jgi:hypothetical protein
MGFVGDLLGMGSDRGSNFRAAGADVLKPVDLNELTGARDTTRGGLERQNTYINALLAQNGIANQGNVFTQQQALANQLQGVANGTGPNPALQQFQNATAQNVANQAAMMAGQRGSGANAGLLARQIAQQGAGIQQQAVGQGALLQAQQQLAGMNALQQQQGMMGNLAGQQIGQQSAALNAYNQAAENNQSNLFNALGQYNNANVSMQSNMNTANAGLANTTAQGQQGLLGGVMNGAGAAVGSLLGLARGGQVPRGYAVGDLVMPMAPAPHFDYSASTDEPANMPASSFGKFWKGMNAAPASDAADQPLFNLAGNNNPGALALQSGLGSGLSKAFGMNQGSMVPGKAETMGDNLKNDKVPAMLSPGEIVVPRSVVNSQDPVRSSAQFVAAVLAKHGRLK